MSDSGLLCVVAGFTDCKKAVLGLKGIVQTQITKHACSPQKNKNEQ